MTTRRTKGSGSIYKRPDSAVYWLKYSRHGKPYRESSGETDLRKAERKLKVRLSEITTGQFIGPQAERIKVAELADDFLREYRINERKSIDDATARWNLHLKPFFGHWKAVDVSSNSISEYIDQRQQEGAKNATINREVAALKRMFRLGQQSTPAKVLRMPHFPHLRENNVRKGFLEDSQYNKLVAGTELWFRALVECGRTYGWRISELLTMKVGQIDLLQRVIRLDPGTTKNSDGREVFLTDALHSLLTACVTGKAKDDAVFTRPNGIAVRSFRDAWEKACVNAGVGQFVCYSCSKSMSSESPCGKCNGKRAKYSGLIFHDLRRTAARNLRRAGISETVIMKIGGWRTRSVFERYAIVSRGDIVEAMQKLETNRRETEQGHDIGHVGESAPNSSTPIIIN
ncbi:tyrosine-type recombinase/integrase [Granulicella mallensis]|uniref:Integrase n=1 Tax=Granulicella mallensis TaxID=940614 RepID=A0A7W7ZUQ0_9BACT|nr:tyrosine-type recombinase/integrase [Granulicella mallensis]MBB5066102.1 integrase [Granulicella mallensis]